MSSLLKYWCRLRNAHHYENDGDPIAVWGPEAVVSQVSYRQVRRCQHCGDAYDTFAGFIGAREEEFADAVVRKAA